MNLKLHLPLWRQPMHIKCSKIRVLIIQTSWWFVKMRFMIRVCKNNKQTNEPTQVNQQTNNYTNTQTHETNKQTNKPTNQPNQTNKQTKTQIHKHKNTQTHEQIKKENKQTNKHTNTRTNKQNKNKTNKHKQTNTQKQTKAKKMINKQNKSTKQRSKTNKLKKLVSASVWERGDSASTSWCSKRWGKLLTAKWLIQCNLFQIDSVLCNTPNICVQSDQTCQVFTKRCDLVWFVAFPPGGSFPCCLKHFGA